MSNAKEILQEVGVNVSKLGKATPKLAEAFMKNLLPAATDDGVLSHKFKELIALALGIASHCEYCIAVHLKKCLVAGATKEEIAEVCGVAVLMGGGPAMMYSAKAIAMLDELAGSN